MFWHLGGPPAANSCTDGFLVASRLLRAVFHETQRGCLRLSAVGSSSTIFLLQVAAKLFQSTPPLLISKPRRPKRGASFPLAHLPPSMALLLLPVRSLAVSMGVPPPLSSSIQGPAFQWCVSLHSCALWMDPSGLASHLTPTPAVYSPSLVSSRSVAGCAACRKTFLSSENHPLCSP